jgi:hypothetical protein
MFDFDNFYTEVMCWTCFRFHKWQLPELLKLLKLDVSGDVDGLWRSRAKKTGVVQYTFQPLELLCMFLGRLASGETSWEKLPLIFGGRSRSSIRAAFYLALDHIHTLFSHDYLTLHMTTCTIIEDSYILSSPHDSVRYTCTDAWLHVY